MLTAASDGSLTALYPAVAAIVVALIGFLGNIVLSRRRQDDDDDTNVISALAAALAAEKERADQAIRRAEQCEAREASHEP